MSTSIPAHASRVGVRTGAGEAVRDRTPEALPTALGIGLLDLAIGVYLNLTLHYLSGDALSRVANAFDVLFGRQPHLAAIGFIWQPLPSLMDMPLLLMRGVWPPLATDGVAGLVVSAFFASVAVWFLLRTLHLFGIPVWWRMVFALLFAANPMIVLYASNGMTDIMLVAVVLASVWGVLSYVETGSLRALTAAGVWLGVGFAIRYEAVPLGFFLAVALAVSMLGSGASRPRIQGSVLLLLTPLLYASALWVFFNWMIMKNPLYFLTSSYSNVSQTSLGAYDNQPLAAARGHILGSLLYVAHMGLLFWPVGVGVAAALALSVGRARDARAPVLLGATLAVPLLQAVLIYQGHSAAWARFFIYYVPTGFLLLSLVASRVGTRPILRNLALTAVALLFVAGNAVNFIEERSSPTVGRGDTPVVTGTLGRQSMASLTGMNQIVRYLDAHPHDVVAVDVFTAFPLVLRLARPQQLIITPDTDFMSIIKNPRGRASDLLVPDPTGVAALDAIDRTWPGLWAGKITWAHLVRAFPGPNHWRLYAVGPNAP